MLVCAMLSVAGLRVSGVAVLLIVSAGVTHTAEQPRVPPMNAVLTVSEMRFCKGDALGDTVLFKGTVAARNISSRPVIHLPGARVRKIVIFDTRESVTGERWSVEPHDFGPAESTSVKESQFRLTPPGERFTFPVQGFLLIAEKASAEALGPGEYWLRVVVDPLDVELDARLRAKLQLKGTLWVQPTLSEPVRVIVPAHPPVRQCDQLDR